MVVHAVSIGQADGNLVSQSSQFPVAVNCQIFWHLSSTLKLNGTVFVRMYWVAA